MLYFVISIINTNYIKNTCKFVISRIYIYVCIHKCKYIKSASNHVLDSTKNSRTILPTHEGTMSTSPKKSIRVTEKKKERKIQKHDKTEFVGLPLIYVVILVCNDNYSQLSIWWIIGHHLHLLPPLIPVMVPNLLRIHSINLATCKGELSTR